LQNPFKRKAITASGDALITLRDPSWNAFPLLGGGAQNRIKNSFTRAQSANYGWMYANSAAVRTVIDVIVRNVGQLELRLYEEVDESERQPRPDHPAAMSMRYPNETTSSDQFVRSMFKDFLIYDNAYAVMVPGVNDRIVMMRIPAYMVEVMGPSLFETSVYRVWPQGAWTTTGTWGGFGTPVDYRPDQIMHWHGEHPLDPRIGLSKLDTLRDVVAEDAALQQATVELAQSGLQEPVWVKRPLDAPDIKADALKALEEDIANRIISRNRKPPVMAEGMTLESFGISPQDAQMLEVRRWAVERVAVEYGVPLAIVGLGTGREGNLVDAQAALYTDTLLPYCEDFSKFITHRILVRVYDWPAGVYEFSFDEKLMGSDRLRAFVTATGRPVMLTNEARAKMNLPPVAGGDDLVTPLNVLVGDELSTPVSDVGANPLPSVGVMPIQDPNGPAQDGSYRSGQGSASETPKALTERKASEVAQAIERADIVAERHPDAIRQLHPRRDAEIRRQHRNIDELQGVVQHHFNRLTRDLRAKARTDSETQWDRWDQEFANDLNTTLKRVVRHEGELQALRFGGHDFDMRRVENYLRAMSDGAATAINETVRQEIKDLGLDNALARASQHVQSSGTSLGARSTIWAREEAARQSPDGGHGRLKSWVADQGRHAEFDGDTVALDDDWPAGFSPGSAPGCACTAVVA
jgi:HK97 family phage portal protein